MVKSFFIITLFIVSTFLFLIISEWKEGKRKVAIPPVFIGYSGTSPFHFAAKWILFCGKTQTILRQNTKQGV
jgi:hypothetical protein